MTEDPTRMKNRIELNRLMRILYRCKDQKECDRLEVIVSRMERDLYPELFKRMKPIKLAIADDHKIFRNGLKATLEDCVDFELIIEASNGKELIGLLATKIPDVVLMDIKMPEMDGITTAERLNFKRKKTWKELLWNGYVYGYNIELTTGKILLKRTPMTMKRLQTLVKHGEQVLNEVKTKECLMLSTW